jgi:hypothetical protein
VLGLAIEPEDPGGLAHLIVGKIETLDGAGRLTARARDEMVEPLERALRAIERGHAEPARRQLEAFLRLVGRHRDRGVLTGPEADGLSAAARAAVAAL